MRKAVGSLYGVAVLAEGLTRQWVKKGLVSAVPGGSLGPIRKVVRVDSVICALANRVRTE
jgi:hypothetical protein